MNVALDDLMIIYDRTNSFERIFALTRNQPNDFVSSRKMCNAKLSCENACAPRVNTRKKKESVPKSRHRLFLIRFRRWYFWRWRNCISDFSVSFSFRLHSKCENCARPLFRNEPNKRRTIVNFPFRLCIFRLNLELELNVAATVAERLFSFFCHNFPFVQLQMRQSSNEMR